AGAWYTLVRSLVPYQSVIHRLVMQEAIPHGDVSADIVGDRPGHTVSGINQRAWDIAEGLYQEIRIKVFGTGPQSIKSHILCCEICGSSQQNQVSEGFTGEKRGIHS